MDIRAISTAGYNFWSAAVQHVTIPICKPDIITDERGVISVSAKKRISEPIIAVGDELGSISLEVEEKITGPSIVADDIKPIMVTHSTLII